MGRGLGGDRREWEEPGSRTRKLGESWEFPSGGTE